ncbi:RNA-binding domain-containing protein [Foetidibacter luteolus]|uniref:RNA-binding domain-containing protein n=1 Tax=Foetidibacter luteolus TaxID=2608880 RepID=UPI00129BABA1|nr:RNA-binding domain-containing protein [Foetidibacter luteolus]
MTQHQLVQKLKMLRSLPAETETVEFKEAKNDFHFDKLGKYFSALSNEANLKSTTEAWLVFGIENLHKSIVGTNYRNQNRASLDRLKGEIASKTSNRITFLEIYELNLPEGRVLLFQIPPAPKGIPIAWDGHYYGRDGEELSPLNLEEIERIRKQASRVDWSAEICREATISDLDEKAILLAKENYKVKNPRLATEIDSWDTSTFLNKAKITIGNRITNSAIILLGKPEAEHFLSPAHARITWILKDKDNFEKDYQHFSCPFILAIDQVYLKIRNLKYRYIKDETLFPEEVDQYDPFTIREALSNCIAHQDYSLGGRINVVEQEDGYLTFSNLGAFLPGSIETVIESNEPPEYYRNGFLVNSMVSLNMIDTVGSGIKRMFKLQSKKFFPMPDYDIGEAKVKATLTGKILDTDFAKVLATNPGLKLSEILMLDKVQKKKELSDFEIAHLRERGFIEGRKPNFHISFSIAQGAGQKADYIKNRGLKDQHYKDLILEFIDKYGAATKSDIDELIIDILPNVLSLPQKQNKVRNLVYSMSKRDRTINNQGTQRKPIWKRIKSHS